MAQTLQREGELPRVQGDIAAQAAKASLFGHLHRRLTAAVATDADAGRVRARVAKGTTAPSADPFTATIVPLLLLLHALKKLLA